MASPSREIVSIYRNILKLAAQYPSVKRAAIIEDIKIEFRANKSLTDPQQIKEKIASARQGIQELSMYASLNPTAGNWTVEVGRNVGSSDARPVKSQIENKAEIKSREELT
jgi:hypothetical protein